MASYTRVTTTRDLIQWLKQQGFRADEASQKFWENPNKYASEYHLNVSAYLKSPMNEKRSIEMYMRQNQINPELLNTHFLRYQKAKEKYSSDQYYKASHAERDKILTYVEARRLPEVQLKIDYPFLKEMKRREDILAVKECPTSSYQKICKAGYVSGKTQKKLWDVGCTSDQGGKPEEVLIKEIARNNNIQEFSGRCAELRQKNIMCRQQHNIYNDKGHFAAVSKMQNTALNCQRIKEDQARKIDNEVRVDKGKWMYYS